PYDIIPLIPIVEGAGGVVTDWQGESAMAGGLVVAAANPELHAQALDLLNA
ncbi:MAG: histidinol-phosphatase, partial [Deltaproteobacteria bacterium]|nr:histidinol-phosphatase [Deltaproteobacteria bacterium]